jgi:hypothetical protein
MVHQDLGAFELILVSGSDVYVCVCMACNQLGTLKARLLCQPDLAAGCLNVEAFVGEPVSSPCVCGVTVSS